MYYVLRNLDLVNFVKSLVHFSGKKKIRDRRSSHRRSNNFEHLFSQTFSSIFKTVGVTALAVNTFLSLKFGEHDVTLTSFAGDLSYLGSQFLYDAYNGRGRGTCKNHEYPPIISRDIAGKREGGSKKPPPPVRWGLTKIT